MCQDEICIDPDRKQFNPSPCVSGPFFQLDCLIEMVWLFWLGREEEWWANQRLTRSGGNESFSCEHQVYQARLGTRQSDLSPLDRGGTAPSGTWACVQTSLIHHIFVMTSLEINSGPRVQKVKKSRIRGTWFGVISFRRNHAINLYSTLISLFLPRRDTNHYSRICWPLPKMRYADFCFLSFEILPVDLNKFSRSVTPLS
jgi:hypothetical protein